uniref:Elongation factor 1-delta n=2 Tax=Crocodylus porosus TaxID=8502 RepID=A0A7M4F7F9_CROPO
MFAGEGVEAACKVKRFFLSFSPYCEWVLPDGLPCEGLGCSMFAGEGGVISLSPQLLRVGASGWAWVVPSLSGRGAHFFLKSPSYCEWVLPAQHLIDCLDCSMFAREGGEESMRGGTFLSLPPGEWVFPAGHPSGGLDYSILDKEGGVEGACTVQYLFLFVPPATVGGCFQLGILVGAWAVPCLSGRGRSAHARWNVSVLCSPTTLLAVVSGCFWLGTLLTAGIGPFLPGEVVSGSFHDVGEGVGAGIVERSIPPGGGEVPLGTRRACAPRAGPFPQLLGGAGRAMSPVPLPPSPSGWSEPRPRMPRAGEPPPFARLEAAWTQSGPCTSRHGHREMAANFLMHEKIWFDKYKYDDAERRYYEQINGPVASSSCQQENGASTILRDIARARENIQKSLAGSASTTSAAGPSGDQSELISRISTLELENRNLRSVVADLQHAISKLESRLSTLERSSTSHQSSALLPTQHVTPMKKVEPLSASSKKVELPSAPPARKTAEPPAADEDEDDDDIDLFGSDDEEEDQEAAMVREERLRQYAEKKAKKPGLIAKSSILLDVKPWDDETDMAEMEECVRSIQMDGLVWGASKLVPVGYGIKKLQIQCVVEDDKVGTDILEEEITKFEDYVQSVDIAAFNKI